MRTRFGLSSLLYARCLARFEAISARFPDFPALDINSKLGQRSYCATRSYFLLAALLCVQKLRPAKRVIMAPLLLPLQITDFHFTKYRFSFCKLQIFILQNTDFHFAKYRFSFRKLQISQNTDFHFVSMYGYGC